MEHEQHDSTNLPMSGFPKGTGVNPECEISFEGGDDLEKLHHDCVKNPGHTSFIPVSDFQISHLPREYQTEKKFKKIKELCDLTVKIELKYISLERPDTYADSDEQYPYSGKFRGSKRIRRFGTGFVYSFDADGKKSHIQGQRCPCPLCKNSDSPQMEYWTLLVGTATHVIFDDSEAACAVIQCFFDTEDRNGVKVMHGISLKSTSLEFNKHHSDMCYINCVTHDKDLFSRLHKLCCNYNFSFDMDSFNFPMSYLISHPHGCSKRITFGKILHFTEPIDSEHPVNTPIMFEEWTVCRLPLFPWSRPGGEDNTMPPVDSDLAGDDKTEQSDLVESTNTLACEHKSNELTITTSTSKEKEDGKTAIQTDAKNDCSIPMKESVTRECKQKRCDDDSNPLEKVQHTAPNPEKESQATVLKDNAGHDYENSTDCSLLGATSLAFQESLENSTATSSNDPELLQTLGEMTDEELRYNFKQSSEIGGMSDGLFLPIPGFDFASLFGTDVPPPPPGAFLVLSPELEYQLRSLTIDTTTNTTEFSLKPGEECILPFGTTYTLPPEADYAKRFASLNPAWYTLPARSKFTTPDGKDIPLPPEAEFLCDRMSVRFSYVTHDIGTCPGSSGATIYQEGVGLPFSVYKFCHFGTMSDGYMRSGLQNLFLKL